MLRSMLSVLSCGALAAAAMLAGAGAASAATPIGHVDSVYFDEKYQTIDVEGWAGDADAGKGSIRVHVYVDGKGAGAESTGLPRPDVAAVHPNLGPNTGFYVYANQAPGRGTHNVCVYAINVGTGSNALLGCRTVQVTLPGALRGHIDSIAVDPSDPSQRIASGWVLDPYDAVSPTPFALVPESGSGYDSLPGSAGSPRPDVDHVYPHNGHNHGFSLRFAASDVSWVAGDRICMAINYLTPGQTGPLTPYCFTYAG